MSAVQGTSRQEQGMRVGRLGWVVGVLLACGGAAWAAPQRVRPAGVDGVAQTEGVLLRWGSGAGEVGLRPSAPEFPAAGVESVAIAPDGSTWLLDRQNTRVVRVGGTESFVVPADVVELSIGPDRTFAGFSLLRSRVFVFGGSGEALGELPIPREFKEITGISVGPSRQVAFQSAYQETFPLGSPSVPQTVASMRAGYREGAAFLSNGDGVAVVRAEDGTLSLLVQRMAERTQVVARQAFAKGALSGRVVGVAGDVACVRVEREASARPFRVGRRVTCVQARTGEVVLDEALPAKGLFLPTRELAVGGSPAKVVHISPEREGLRVRSWALPAGVVR